MARARNRKGQFTRRAAPVAIARATASAPTRRRPSSVARRGSGGVPRRRSSRGVSTTSNRVRGGVAAAGFAIGYINKNYSSTVAKIPAIKGSHILTAAAVSHFLVKPRPGSWADHATTAAAAIGGYELGSSGIIGDEAAVWE